VRSPGTVPVSGPGDLLANRSTGTGDLTRGSLGHHVVQICSVHGLHNHLPSLSPSWLISLLLTPPPSNCQDPRRLDVPHHPTFRRLRPPSSPTGHPRPPTTTGNLSPGWSCYISSVMMSLFFWDTLIYDLLLGDKVRCVARGTGTLKDRDEVNKQEVCECDGWVWFRSRVGDDVEDLDLMTLQEVLIMDKEHGDVRTDQGCHLRQISAG
jgi:hypothetical protein